MKTDIGNIGIFLIVFAALWGMSMLMSTAAFIMWLVVYCAGVVYFASERKVAKRAAAHNDFKNEKLRDTLGRD